MSRFSTTALVAAFLVAGSAFGQSAPLSRGPVLGAPIPMESVPPTGAMGAQHFDSSGPEESGGLWWGYADFLLGTIRGERLPALVTTSPVGTARAAAGVLGQPGTQTLFGDEAATTQGRAGVRAYAGYWFDPDRCLGIESGFLILDGAKQVFASASDGNQILARPFIDAATKLQASALSGFPGSSSGSILASDVSHRFQTGTIDVRANAYASSSVRIDSMIGYRYLKFEDRLLIQQNVQPTAGPFASGTNIASTDDFRARNSFHGADIGVRAEFSVSDDLTLELLGKVSGGALYRVGNINGSQVVTVPGVAPAVSTGGLLALSSNIGESRDHTTTAIPELGATLGWQVNPNLRFRVGYTMIMVPNALRAGDLVDPVVNTNLIPPATATATSTDRPGLHPANSDLWMHAVSAGVELRY